MRISDWSSDVCSSDLREVIGAEPVLPNDDRVTGNRTHLFHEAREMEGDLRIGRLIVGFRWSDRLCLSEAVGLYDRKRVVSGKSVSVRVGLGGRRIIKNKTRHCLSHS